MITASAILVLAFASAQCAQAVQRRANALRGVIDEKDPSSVNLVAGSEVSSSSSSGSRSVSMTSDNIQREGLGENLPYPTVDYLGENGCLGMDTGVAQCWGHSRTQKYWIGCTAFFDGYRAIRSEIRLDSMQFHLNF